MTARDIDSPDIRSCGSELLSLALMDARNHTLHLLGLFDAAAAEGKLAASPVRGMDPPWWVAGHLGWFAEAWISRNPQRSLGSACPAQPLRLASIEPEADRWWSPALAPADQRWAMELPDAGTVRAWLLETLETTLDLLARTPEDDAALYFYRLALFHEDLRGEQLITLAQTMGLPLKLALPGGAAPREPLQVPATRWALGARQDAQPSGFVWDQDKWAHPVDVPEFEIDAQPVTWAQMVEFVDDGGYDRPELWHPEGRAWLQQLAEGDGRRGPRHVEQIGVASGAVMQTLFGKPVRMSGSQSAMHVSWWEADAWCRWAGRRLPSEVEWEVAAQTAARRGFRWGDVHEWTGTTLRPWAGYTPDPWVGDAEWAAAHVWGQAKVRRGASLATRLRMKHPTWRGYALPGQDMDFVGFRSCGF